MELQADPGPLLAPRPEQGATGCRGSWEGSCAQHTSRHGGVRVNIPALSNSCGWCGRPCLWETGYLCQRLGPFATHPGSALSCCLPTKGALPPLLQDSSASQLRRDNSEDRPSPPGGETGLST